MEIGQLKNALIEGAIDVVSKKGLVGATTSAIGQRAHCNEAYIYRLFGGKRELLKATFERLDTELANCIEYGIKKNHDSTIEEDFNKIFLLVWEFLLEKRDRTAFLIRYYHSSFYTGGYDVQRKKAYEKVLSWMSMYLKPDCDAWWLLNQIYDLLFNTIGRIFKGEEKDELSTRNRIYGLIYYILSPYLKG